MFLRILQVASINDRDDRFPTGTISTKTEFCRPRPLVKTPGSHHTNMRTVTRVVAAIAIAVALLPLLYVPGQADGTQPSSRHRSGARLAATNSWLECCLHDLDPDSTDVLRVCPPGSCPGHFDIKPGQLAGIRDCLAMFRFDFQSSFEDKIRPVAGEGLRTISVPASEGLCIPENYLTACQAVHRDLCRLQPDRVAVLDAALTATRGRIADLAEEVHARIADAHLSGTRVVVSGHQAAFCRWLGLEIAGAYSGGEAASPAQLQELVSRGREAGVRFVIANLQEGRQMGEALAYHLGAKVVVFSNFPDMTASQNTFDALVRANVDNLVAAANRDARPAPESGAASPEAR